MTEQETNNILDIALSYKGYMEKKDKNVQFYENFEENSGDKNYTRFGRISSLILKNADNDKMNPNMWCAMFVLSCIYESKAGKINTSSPIGSLTPDQNVINWMKQELAFGGSLGSYAACTTWYENFQKKGRTGNQPIRGAFAIFMATSDSGKRYGRHIGIVNQVNGNQYTTIEGNTNPSTNDSVHPNGGKVWENTRTVGKGDIIFCYPQEGITVPIDGMPFAFTGGSMYGTTLSPNYGSSDTNKPNKITKLANSRNRKKNSEPNVNEERKKNFDALADKMIENAPQMGRDINKSQEMYGAEILKGDQVSKRRIR